MDQPKRTLAKTLTWRVIALLTTMAVVYLYTGSAKDSVIVGVVANFLKMFFYYVHERVWNRLSFGRKKPLEYEI